MRRFIGFRFFVSLTVLVVVAGLVMVYVSYCHYYWQQNTRLLRAGWNMMKLLRQHNLLILVDGVEEQNCVPSGGGTEATTTAAGCDEPEPSAGGRSQAVATFSCRKPAVTRHSRFFSRFCEHWASTRSQPTGRLPRTDPNARHEDAEMLRAVSRVPIEYAQYARIDGDRELTKHWHRFVSGQCSDYYDKLLCLNGLVFDWSAATVHWVEDAEPQKRRREDGDEFHEAGPR